MEAMMIRTNKLAIVFCLFFALGVALDQGCAKAPLNFSPQATAEFQNLQIGKAIDLVRDIAQDGSRTNPPIVSRASALKVTNWHTAIVKTLDARGPNWKTEVTTGMTELLKLLTPAEQETLRPYFSLVGTVIAAL
jgi:hypothetical protein